MNNVNYKPVQTTPFKLSVKLKSHLWKIINRTVFRFMPLRFKWYRITLLRIFGAKLASDVTIDRFAIVDHPWNLTMGSLSSLGKNSWAYCLAPITIGANSCISNDVYLLTGSHDVSDLNFGYVLKEIVIGSGCWIATGSYVLPGIILSDYTVVGAKSLVTKNTEMFDIVGGNPAKLIGKREFKS